jgi:large subunit ribosomal protein L30
MAKKKQSPEPFDYAQDKLVEGTEKRLRITWVKSGIGYSRRQKATIRALGFKRLGQTVEQKDTPVIRGMVNKVGHLVEVEEVES